MKLISRFFNWLKRPFARRSMPNARPRSRNFLVRYRYLFALVPLLIIGIVVAMVAPAKVTPQSPQQPAEPSIKVREHIVGNVYKTTATVSAVASPVSTTTIVAQSGGVVTSVAPVSGQSVKEGDVLVTLGSGNSKTNTASLGLQQAQAQLKQAYTGLGDAKKTRDAQLNQAQVGVVGVQDQLELGRQQAAYQRDALNQIETQLAEIEGDMKNLPRQEDANPQQLAEIARLKNAAVGLRVQVSGQRSAMAQALEAFDESNPQLTQAEAAKRLAEVGANATVNAAASGVDLARIQVESAKLMADMANVRAPFSGRIDRIKVRVGDTVSPGTPITTIVSGSEFRLYAMVSSETADRILVGEEATIAYDGVSETGYVSNVDFNPDPQTRLYEVEITPYTFTGRSGKVVDLALPIGLPKSVDQYKTKSVPLDSLYIATDGTFVFVNDNGVAKRRLVKTGQIFAESVMVTEGLQDGDHVIVQRELTDGQKVEVQS